MCAEPQFFNDRGAVQTMKNRLPHWEQDGCTYFITFRLADSLPKQLLDTWKEERRVWMVRHPKPWSSEVEQAYHHRFSGARERWLDAGHGHCVLRQLSAREALLDVIDQQSCDVWSVVMMPNHVHVLVSFSAGLELSALMQRLKGGSSLEINKRIGRRGPLWAKDYFDGMPATFTSARGIFGGTL